MLETSEHQTAIQQQIEKLTGIRAAISVRTVQMEKVSPVPESSGLGVHVTIDLAGKAKFGPDVEWIDNIDYSINLNARDNFVHEIQKYWPSISKASLQPGYAGIRPRTYPIDGPPTDFIIQGHEIHNIKGMVNLYGIESPGLTSSLAIADKVLSLLN